MYVALARGLYADEALELENVVLSASTTQTQALIAGDLHMNTYSVDSMAKAVLAGTPLKLVGSAQTIPNFQLIVAHDVTRFADLRGKTLGAGSPGGYFDIVLRGMLSAHGLEASDYQMFSISNPRARVPAIKLGQIAGALVGGPDDSAAIAEGFNSLGYVHETIPDLDYSGYAVEDGWARAHEAQVVGFLRATLRAVAWLRDPANRDEATRIYGTVTELPPEFLDKLYEQMIVQQMLSLTMRPNLKGIENVLLLGFQQGSLSSVPPVAAWVDERYLDAASR
jgi:NitT/TauT family transport system substrate-binding protein